MLAARTMVETRDANGSQSARAPSPSPVSYSNEVRGQAIREAARRVESEYREMPGLRLTLPQAARLWGLERGTCELVVRTWDVFHYVPLEPPYQTTMYRRPSGVEEANLSLSGTGGE